MTETRVARCSKADPVRQAALFWQKVDLNGPNGCWLYMGFRKWDGYGWLARYINGKAKYLTAHRYAWILTHGQPPVGMHILHSCDNPPCCNPAHLRLGTHQDNMADQKAKLRHTFGARGGKTKLTWDQVQEIRASFRKKNYRDTNSHELAAKYGVTPAVITGIAAFRTWKVEAPSEKLHPGRVRPERKAA